LNALVKQDMTLFSPCLNSVNEETSLFLMIKKLVFACITWLFGRYVQQVMFQKQKFIPTIYKNTNLF